MFFHSRWRRSATRFLGRCKRREERRSSPYIAPSEPDPKSQAGKIRRFGWNQPRGVRAGGGFGFHSSRHREERSDADAPRNSGTCAFKGYPDWRSRHASLRFPRRGAHNGRHVGPHSIGRARHKRAMHAAGPAQLTWAEWGKPNARSAIFLFFLYSFLSTI